MELLLSWSVWHWLVLGFALLIAEAILPGVFLLWWGLAALCAALLQWAFPAISLSALGVGYALLAALLSWAWWRYQHQRDDRDQRHTTLNQRDHLMRGKEGEVEQIAANGIGRGRFGDTTWRIQGENLKPQDLIRVVAVEGITLIVTKVEK